jgi:uncharacterized protein YjbI with pentapeptide repeats
MTAIAIIAVGYLPKANSFSGFQGKTLWDWLSLLVVPASLAGLGALLQLKDQDRAKKQADLEREIADKNRQQDLKIAEDNRQEEALQHYLDRVSNLLIEKNLLAIAANVARGKNTPEEKELLDVSLDVIRTMTLTVLQRLDGNRKGIVVQFLVESDIIKRPKAILSGANLVGIVLHDANLSDANLSGANLENADLGKAGLGDANLSYTNLVGANLENTAIVNSNLYKADLTGAKLQGAYLWYTYLSGAKLNGAKLEATQILYTDLSDAEGLTEEQLEKTYLCKAKLTEELNIDPNRNCEMFEA